MLIFVMFSSAVTLFIITVETHLSLCGANGSGFAPELLCSPITEGNANIPFHCFESAAVTVVSEF